MLLFCSSSFFCIFAIFLLFQKYPIAMKIIVTRESITFDNEVYEWDKYKIFVNLGNIIVKEQDGTNILSLGPTALIHRPNLLEVIVSTLGKK